MRTGTLVHHHDFRALWGADAISQVGTMVTTLALPLVAVQSMHASPFEVGLLTTFETLAFLLIGLPAGAWVDRVRRRPLLIGCDLGRAVLLATIPLSAHFGVLHLGQLYGLVLVFGALTVFFDVAHQSYLPVLVGRADLVEGNAKLQGTQSIAQVGGPGLGGVLVQLLTAPVALLADSVSFVGSAAWLSTIRRREERPVRETGSRLRHEIAEGVRFIASDPLLRAIAGCTASFNLASSAVQPMLLVLLARDLHLAAGAIGLIFSAGAAGGLAGALFARRLAAAVGEGPVIWLSTAVTTPFLLCLPFLHRDWTLAVLVAALLIGNAGATVYNIAQVSFRQRLCPDRLLGRMNATMRFLVWGTMPLGGLIGGALGSAVGVRTTLLTGAIASMCTFLPVFFSPLRRMRELPSYEQEPALSRPEP